MNTLFLVPQTFQKNSKNPDFLRKTQILAKSIYVGCHYLSWFKNCREAQNFGRLILENFSIYATQNFGRSILESVSIHVAQNFGRLILEDLSIHAAQNFGRPFIHKAQTFGRPILCSPSPVFDHILCWSFL